MWHAYEKYNFEVCIYIKWVGILSKGKKPCKVCFVDSETTAHNQRVCTSCTSCTVGIMGPVYVDWLIKLARSCIAIEWDKPVAAWY